MKKNQKLITRNKSICRGGPILRGTRISVALVILHLIIMKVSIQEFLGMYPHLTEAQLTACREYYRTHTAEIDTYIEDLQENQMWEEASLTDLEEFDQGLNKSLDFLNNPEEDIYTEQDGDPL